MILFLPSLADCYCSQHVTAPTRRLSYDWFGEDSTVLAHTPATLLCATALALSALASPLYLSVPSRAIMKAEDFKKPLDSPYVMPPAPKDASHAALEIMLQGRQLRSEDEGQRANRESSPHVLYAPKLIFSSSFPNSVWPYARRQSHHTHGPWARDD